MKHESTKTTCQRFPWNSDLLSNRETLIKTVGSWLKKAGYYSMFTAVPGMMTTSSLQATTVGTEKSDAGVAVRSAGPVEKPATRSAGPNLLNGQGSLLVPRFQNETNSINDLTGTDNCPGTAVPAGTYTAAAPYQGAGNTTGANNTVGVICPSYYCYYSYQDVSGPDHLYTFTLTDRGTDPKIKIVSNTPNYSPLVYAVAGGGCPTGTNNYLYSYSWLRMSNSSELSLSDAPINEPLQLFVDSRSLGDSGSYSMQIQDVTLSATVLPTRNRADFDGDRRTDIAVYRPSSGEWWLRRSSDDQVSVGHFGDPSDIITPGDFTRDGKTDIAIWRPATGDWYIYNSVNNSFSSYHFGLSGDIPEPADYDGDGVTDIAVYRPSEGKWYIQYSGGSIDTILFGESDDRPVADDYDGDGKSELAIVRDNDATGRKEWWIYSLSQQNISAVVNFGVPGDKAVAGDFTGDGKADIAVFRPSDGNWYINPSENRSSYFAFPWGIAEDVPVPGDYDGDGKIDAAVYRPSSGTWYVNRTGGQGPLITNFGLSTDIPVPSSLVR